MHFNITQKGDQLELICIILFVSRLSRLFHDHWLIQTVEKSKPTVLRLLGIFWNSATIKHCFMAHMHVSISCWNTLKNCFKRCQMRCQAKPIPFNCWLWIWFEAFNINNFRLQNYNIGLKWFLLKADKSQWPLYFTAYPNQIWSDVTDWTLNIHENLSCKTWPHIQNGDKSLKNKPKSLCKVTWLACNRF